VYTGENCCRRRHRQRTTIQREEIAAMFEIVTPNNTRKIFNNYSPKAK
jgi:hypothetical protein